MTSPRGEGGLRKLKRHQGPREKIKLEVRLRSKERMTQRYYIHLLLKNTVEMPHYISLINWTEQGIKNVKDSPKRAQAVRKAIEKIGGKLQLLYYTMGQYDIVAIVEAPDDATAMQILLAIGSQGNVRTTTMKAFPESQGAKIIGKVA